MSTVMCRGHREIKVSDCNRKKGEEESSQIQNNETPLCITLYVSR